MTAIGSVLCVAQTLFSALQCSQLQEICSILGYKSQLESLKNTVSTIKAVLLDADDKQELSNEALDWIKKLKSAVYDADDLLDEFTTLAEQQQLVESGKVPKKVRLFFSRFNQMGIAYTMSRGIKKIRKKLEGIANNHSQFGFSVDYRPIRRRREETYSYVFEENVIGRDNETREIIDLLLNSNVVPRDICFLTIVGMGGLGKTTLAKLVYNHERIINEFPLRLWVCVGDHGQKHFNMREIVGKIIESATHQKHEDLGIDVLQKKLQTRLEGKKYLLVLDDLWNEDRNECLKLTEFLMGGGRGSRILVTTRSSKVATVVGDGLAYELNGLSDDNSWKLFKLTAFKEGQERSSPDLVDIGKDIVKKCANVPLAIRVVGSLLYSQERSRWLLFQKIGVADIRKGENDIMSILKFSYHHLEHELKSCFTYCALFPKDTEIRKEMLISIWMAQGCIVPFDKGQSIEDAGEEYFSILVRRCFFQGLERDEYGEIVSCEIHDLMHDMAEEVAGKDICLTNSTSGTLDKESHHVCLTFDDNGDRIFTKSRVRTCLRMGEERMFPVKKEFPMDTLLEKWMCLRILDLHDLGIRSLPASIGELLHLRYLDLSSNNSLKTLPKTITKLHNVQTLKLSGCSRLEDLPKDLNKLIKLRFLDISNCNKLTHMPPGMAKFTCLSMLPEFVVGEANSSLEQCASQWEDLKSLNNLKGSLRIRILKNHTHVKEYDKEGGYLRSKEHLLKVEIWWEGDENGTRVDDEELLEDLWPHFNLKGLTLKGYCGVRMPSWGREDILATFLPNLVHVNLTKCTGLKYVPSLGKLHYLKSLHLEELSDLEYMEHTSSSHATQSAFLPSLEKLMLKQLPKLEGWWGDNQVIDNDSGNMQAVWPLFPRLFELYIRECHRLKSIPPCSGVEILVLLGFNEDQMLSIINGRNTENSHPKLRALEISNVGYLKSLPIEAFWCLSHLTIRGDNYVESLSEVGEVFRCSCSSTLRSLSIIDCPKLRGLSRGLEHLTSLGLLIICNCSNLDLTEEGGDDGMPWKSLHHTLRSLLLISLPKLVNLPKGMHYLTSLHSFVITNCCNLETLPPWIPCLSSLRNLNIEGCKRLKSLPQQLRDLTSLNQLVIHHCSRGLTERCQKPTGEDWSKIQHIRHIVIDDEV